MGEYISKKDTTESKYIQKKEKKTEWIKKKKKEPEEKKKWITSKYDKKRPQGGWKD